MAQLVILNHPGEIHNWYAPATYCGAAQVACTFKNISKKLDKRSGKVIEENPKMVRSSNACIVEMVPIKPLCVEPVRECAPLGRIVIRDMKQAVAVGAVKSTIKTMGRDIRSSN